VYILRCADGSLYTGATNDPKRRLAEHAAGDAARYTRSRLPVRLVYEEKARDRAAALRREAALKRLTRAQKLALVEGRRSDEAQRGAGAKQRPKFTVRPVYRAIVKKSERQAGGVFDVLVCGHAVPAAVENTYRKASACPECRVRVQQYVDEHGAGAGTAPPRR
jgi:putative endonuclease